MTAVEASLRLDAVASGIFYVVSTKLSVRVTVLYKYCVHTIKYIK